MRIRAALMCKIGGVLLISLVTLTGYSCSQGADRTDPNSTVTISYGPDIDEHNWATWGYGSEYLVFLGVGEDQDSTVGTVGSLAESWECSEDYRSWTIRLRPDVRWQDGVPVTAHDIKFTLDLLSHAGWDGYSISVLDDSTYTISYHRLFKPLAGSPLARYPVIFPKHLLEDLAPESYEAWEFWTQPVGNGPYRFVRHVPKTMIEFEANPDYYRGKPKIERVILRFGNASLVELLGGNVDIIMGADPGEFLKIADHPQFEMHQFITTKRLDVVGWNQRHPLFRDPRVRRALTLAINRRELHRVMNLSEQTPIFDGILTPQQYLRGEVPEALPLDLEQAKQLLIQVGWQDEDGDGILERNGTQFRFAALAPIREGSYIQSQLRKLGIQMDVTTMDWKIAHERVLNGDFEAAVLFIRPFHGGPSLPEFLDAIGYINQEAIALSNQIRATLNPEELDRLSRQLTLIFKEELPFMVLYPGVGTLIAHRRIRGLRTQEGDWAGTYMENLWIEDE